MRDFSCYFYFLICIFVPSNKNRCVCILFQNISEEILQKYFLPATAGPAGSRCSPSFVVRILSTAEVPGSSLLRCRRLLNFCITFLFFTNGLMSSYFFTNGFVCSVLFMRQFCRSMSLTLIWVPEVFAG